MLFEILYTTFGKNKTKNMKKFLFLLAAISFIGLNSCEKIPTENLGEIPGMGNSDENLQVKEPFTMPDGIIVIGDITGIQNPVNKSSELKSTSDTEFDFPRFGSGFVRLQLTLCNATNYPRTIFFPKGLMWECKNRTSQHGLQCQTTWVCLQPNTTRTIGIDLYCANLGLPVPNQTETYKILGVTNSQLIWNLLNLIGWRKVNYEMCHTSTKGEEGPTYEEIIDRLQTIVHNLTNRGIDISNDDKEFIQSIPELAPEEIPQIDENSQFPEYFEEFKFGK
jgi:hypothetical protein